MSELEMFSPRVRTEDARRVLELLQAAGVRLEMRVYGEPVRGKSRVHFQIDQSDVSKLAQILHLGAPD